MNEKQGNQAGPGLSVHKSPFIEVSRIKFAKITEQN
jgi:hypothetical protein